MRNEPHSSAHADSDDATLITSHSDGDFVSEDEESYDVSQTPDATDRLILEDNEHQQSLLNKPKNSKGMKGIFSRDDNNAQGKQRRRGKRRIERFKKEAQGSGNAELMYEMEGGYKDSSSRSSSESPALLDEKWNKQPAV